jgi:segregation and condensation protein B
VEFTPIKKQVCDIGYFFDSIVVVSNLTRSATVTEFNLKNTLKALLFSTSEPLSLRDLQDVFTRYHEEQQEETKGEGAPMGNGEVRQEVLGEVISQVPSLLPTSRIQDALEEIREQLLMERDVYRLQEGPQGYRLVVAPDYADWVRLLRKEPKPMRLGRAALETLSVIAYRQPVTRGEVEKIRGVAVDSAIGRLLELELIVILGRAELPGRPQLYGTTEKFLEFCGLRTLEDLPASDVLSHRQLDQWLEESDKSYGDRDVGLPEDDEPAVAIPEVAADHGERIEEESADLDDV